MIRAIRFGSLQVLITNQKISFMHFLDSHGNIECMLDGNDELNCPCDEDADHENQPAPSWPWHCPLESPQVDAGVVEDALPIQNSGSGSDAGGDEDQPLEPTIGP